MAAHRTPIARFGTWLTRLILGLVVRCIYRVRAAGLDAVPAEGAALIVANHVTFIDSFILATLCRRPVRFVMHVQYYRLPGLSWFFRMVGAIPIAGGRENPALLRQAMDTIDAALANDEVVVIFPEGQLTRDGEMLPFRPGVERILTRQPVPVVPMALRGLWGSRFSRAGKGAVRRGLRPAVELVGGAAIPAHQADRDSLYAQVAALRGGAA